MTELIDRSTCATLDRLTRVDVCASDDWDLLFDAVEARLTQLAASESDPSAPMQRLQGGVLDCVLALERVHAAFRLESARRRRLELEAFDARMARIARAGGKRPLLRAVERSLVV